MGGKAQGRLAGTDISSVIEPDSQTAGGSQIRIEGERRNARSHPQVHGGEGPGLHPDRAPRRHDHHRHPRRDRHPGLPEPARRRPRTRPPRPTSPPSARRSRPTTWTAPPSRRWLSTAGRYTLASQDIGKVSNNVALKTTEHRQLDPVVRVAQEHQGRADDLEVLRQGRPDRPVPASPPTWPDPPRSTPRRGGSSGSRPVRRSTRSHRRDAPPHRAQVVGLGGR